MSNGLDSASHCVRNQSWWHWLLVLLAALLCQRAPAAGTDYEQVIRELSSAVESEVRDGRISGATIALIDDQQIVFARGFGFADKKRRIAARQDTVYRA